MNRSSRRSLRGFAALAIGLFALVALAPGVQARRPRTTETYRAFLVQVRADQFKRATINRKTHTVGGRLKSGKHEEANYVDGTAALASTPSQEDVALKALLKQHVAHVTVLHPRKAKSGHKLRYIAGGIVLAILIGGAGLWWYGRRRDGTTPPRPPAEAGAPPPGPPPPSPDPGPPPPPAGP